MDRNLSSYDQRHGSTLNTQRPATVPDLVIIETKAPLTHWQDVQDAIQCIHLNASRCSRYCMGIGSFAFCLVVDRPGARQLGAGVKPG